MFSQNLAASRHSRVAKHNVSDSKRLYVNAKKKITTTMIGAISAFEETFGYLWGKEKREEDRTNDEKLFGEMWQRLRNKILDLGNNQARALQNEVDEYNIQWKRYNYNLNVRNPR